MKVKIHSSELGRMMRVLSGCIDQKDQKRSNVEISHDNNLFSIRATNGTQFVSMSTPLLGGDGEKFCVDGKMFANIVSRANGDVDIDTDGKFCTVKGNGRTRIPMIPEGLDSPGTVSGSTAVISASEFASVAERVRYACATDETKIILTGILVEIHDGELTMVAIDGFQLAVEHAVCEGDDMKIVIPNILVKRICDCAGSGEKITLTTDGRRVCMRTETSEVIGSLLQGDYIDWKKIISSEFSTTLLFKVEEMKDALKGSSVVGNAKNLVKFIVNDDRITVTSNSEHAEFDAEISCMKNGNDLLIAFNDKYVLNALGAICGEEAVLNMNTAVTPAVIREKDDDGIRHGIHLLLPVRVN